MNTKEFTKKYYVKRTGTNSVKWDSSKDKDLLPMFIADMDFKLDEKIIEKLAEKINYGCYGYTKLPEDYMETFINWHKERNGITYKAEEIRFTKGAVNAMFQLINALTSPKDSILINTPVYPQFYSSIRTTKRKIVTSSMINNDGYFTMDYEDIEKKIKKNNVKMIIFCSPHNPLGRVFKQGEIEELLDIAKRNNVIVVSDEVHSDLVMPGQTFVPSLALSKYRNNVVTITAVSKTFNLAMFAHCHVVIPSKKLRNKFDEYQKANNTAGANAYNALASYYSYKYGSEWLEGVVEVIYENANYFKKRLGKYLPMIEMEGTYLMFADFSAYTGDKTAHDFLLEECKISTNAGESFGEGFEGWARINLATSKSIVKKCCDRIEAAILK